MPETIVKITDLSHRYSSDWAIRDINFEINKKGILGLLGSNGAGKSTTMNILCGVLNQTEGQVLIKGIDIRKNPKEAKKLIGFLPQHPPLHLELTVDEYLVHTAYLRRIPTAGIRTAVEKAKARCGVAHFSNRLLKNLSGGYRQRVGIAQAIIHEPELVVLDEPTNGLDPNQIIEVRKLIKEIAEERAVIFSSHILHEVQLLCQDIIMVERGKIVFADTMDAFNNYIEPNGIHVWMQNPPTDEVLLAIPGIEKVDRQSDHILILETDRRPEVNDYIVEESVKNKWGLREITPFKSSLDDIFKQLSSNS